MRKELNIIKGAVNLSLLSLNQLKKKKHFNPIENYYELLV